MTKPEFLLSRGFLLFFVASAGVLGASTIASAPRGVASRAPSKIAVASTPRVLKSPPAPVPTKVATGTRVAWVTIVPRTTIQIVPNGVSSVEITPSRSAGTRLVATTTVLLPGTMVRFKRISRPEELFSPLPSLPTRSPVAPVASAAPIPPVASSPIGTPTMPQKPSSSEDHRPEMLVGRKSRQLTAEPLKDIASGPASRSFEFLPAPEATPSLDLGISTHPALISSMTHSATNAGDSSPSVESASSSGSVISSASEEIVEPSGEELFPVISFPGGPEFRVYPGSVCKVGRQDLSLLMGRVRVLVPENGSPTTVLGRLCRFEISFGEALAQVDTDSNSTFALVDGEGWVRGDERSEEVLTAGKGITVGRDGKLGKLGEMDPRLQEPESLPTFGPTAWMRRSEPVAEVSPPASASAVASESHIASDSALEPDSFRPPPSLEEIPVSDAPASETASVASSLPINGPASSTPVASQTASPEPNGTKIATPAADLARPGLARPGRIAP